MSRGAEGTRRSGGGGRDSDGGASLIGGKGTALWAVAAGRHQSTHSIHRPGPGRACLLSCRGPALSDDEIQDTYTHGGRPIEMALD